MKKLKLNIPNPLAPVISYLKTHLGRAKSEADAEKRVLFSLNIVGRTLLLLGLFTSFTFIVPTVLQLTGFTINSFFGVVAVLLACAGYAALFDLSVGVNAPYAFYKWESFIINPSIRGLSKAASSTLLVVCQINFSMYCTWHGNTYVTELIVQDDKPKGTAEKMIALDNAKHQAEENIRKKAEAQIAEAKKADKANQEKAAKVTKVARHNAAKKYPNHKVSEWERQRYNKLVASAIKDSAKIADSYQSSLPAILNRIEGKVHTSNQTHQYGIDAEKKHQQEEREKYDRKLMSTRLLVRDVGYWGTPGFVVICLIIVLIGGGVVVAQPRTKSAPPQDNKAEIQAAKKHLTQYIKDFNNYMSVGNFESAETAAKNVLERYETIKKLDIGEYNGLLKRYAATLPSASLYRPDDIEQYITA